MSVSSLPELPPHAFTRIDESDDAEFYLPARMVTHIDTGAIAALGEFYAGELPTSGMLFDLMSSWVSHLPEGFENTEVIGHGMNAQELEANCALSRWFVQDLNRNPILPLNTASLDGAMCAVSVQYLQSPVDVFTEVRRCLKPQAPFIVSFSNRCFPTKAVAIWRSLDLRGQARLVALYLERAGFCDIKVRVPADGLHGGDPLIAVTGYSA